ncbi:MAG: response regulator [Candidatus Faecousia sp.]|nr:response regulator [Bacillota bacterium]MDY4599480.1 response regulator [Candidatus Faecousia sp.]
MLAAIALCIGLGAVGIQYYGFVTRTIYTESTEHLREIYHQANQSLYSLVGRNWGAMHMWTPYLQSTLSDRQMESFAAKAKEETGFTDFYFISREGSYRTVSGDSGYLDMKEELPALILEHKDVVVNAVVPGRPQIMVFAVPAAHGSYQGFAYEAIAISFTNDDLVKSLEITAFNGQSNSYVVRPDGRVVVDGSNGQYRAIYNVLAMLREYANLSEEAIDTISGDFHSGNSGAAVFEAGGVSYYLVYESANFEDWVVLGIVPTAIVNASMNRLQSTTLILVTVVAAGIAVTLLIYVIRRNRRNLRKKDTELLYREELFAALSGKVDDIFMMLGAKDLRVDYLSPNVEKLVGIPEEEARANIRVLDETAKNREIPLIFDQLLAIQPGQQVDWDREYVHRKTGEDRWFRGTALCREIRGRKKYILVLSDRTKERRTNRALEDAVNVAQSANKAKSTFLTNMSHDIRTPMNAIIGFTTLAIANVGSTEKVKDYLSKILSSSNHLLSLINDVLDMSRIESGKLHIEEQEANLADIFHDLKNIISGQIDAKQLELYMDIMDVADEDVYCDKTRLNQVLLNLLSNAIKFTPPGGTVSVRVSQLPNAPQGKGLYEIRVKDTGIGMSQEFAAHIFEPFEREQTTAVSRTQGTGLGMAITKNILDMMGGEIEVFTRQGKGTEFVIRLALRLQSARRNVEKIRELVDLKALVVDDDFNTCDSVTKMLVKVGMRSEWTMFGKEAVLRARQSIEMNDPFHAYIIDWRLPDMNGIEVTRQIRALGDDTPIIILTAYDWADIEIEAKAAGVTAFCAKPMFLSDLRESLLTALEQMKNRGSLPPASEAGSFRGKHLLLAEDNDLNREIALEVLDEYGFVIDTAENGSAAVHKVSTAAPGAYDLVLMDIQMPVMDGLEATRRIRALENPALSHIPIIAMTANAFDEDRRAAARCGMNGFISKPIDIDEVVATLHQIFG